MPRTPIRRKTIKNNAKHALGLMSKQAVENISNAVNAGDLQASLRVVEWVLPKPKPTNQESLELAFLDTVEGMGIVEAVRLVQNGMMRGDITVELAANALSALLSGHKILELADFEARLLALELQPILGNDR